MRFFLVKKVLMKLIQSNSTSKFEKIVENGKLKLNNFHRLNPRAWELNFSYIFPENNLDRRNTFF